eukprot:2646484-Pyramimonas_sp.AAC.1
MHATNTNANVSSQMCLLIGGTVQVDLVAHLERIRQHEPAAGRLAEFHEPLPERGGVRADALELCWVAA